MRKARAASGEAGIVIGTHALLGAGVASPTSAWSSADEQFGVEQRAALGAKAATRPHVLVMTATPIRSVAMTVFGDLEILDLGARSRVRASRRRARWSWTPSPAGVGRSGLAADRRRGRAGQTGVRGLRADLEGRGRS